MRPFTDGDFPVTAIGDRVYRRLESSPICTASDDDMAKEIAKRLNQANQVYPDEPTCIEHDYRERW